MNIGNNIMKIRQKQKITAKWLAKQVGISQGYLSEIENNKKTPTANVLDKIAEVLNVSVDYLLGRTDNPNTIALEGNQIPEELRNENVELIEVIKDAKDSGLTPDEIKEILEFAQNIKKKYLKKQSIVPIDSGE